MAMAEAYKSFRDAQQGRKDLQDLVESLSFSHIRALHEMVSRIHFRCDILGNLPPELNEQIIQHLPLYQRFQARRVSRRWKEILLSDRLIKQGLGSWNPANDTSTTADLTNTSQQYDAYHRGYPFSLMVLDIGYDKSVHDSGLIAYADGVLAWINSNGRRAVELLDISSGCRKTLVPPNRHELIGVAMTSTIITALSSTARCYIWNTEQGILSRTLQLEAALDRTMLVSKSTVALVNTSIAEGISFARVVTWNADTRKATDFVVSLECPNDMCLRCGLSDEGRSFILFSHVQSRPKEKASLFDMYNQPQGGSEPSCNMRFLRSDLLGTIMAQGSEPCPMPDHGYCRATQYMCFPFTSPLIDVFLRSSESGHGTSEQDLIMVNYDPVRDGLRVKIARLHGSMWEDWFIGRDVVLYPTSIQEEQKEEGMIRLADLSNGEVRVAKSIGESIVSTHHRCDQPIYHHHFIFEDGRFLVSAARAGIMIWCFDPQITMPNEDIEFRHRRRQQLSHRVNELWEQEELLKQIGQTKE